VDAFGDAARADEANPEGSILHMRSFWTYGGKARFNKGIIFAYFTLFGNKY
jgi:hypothetical protein